MFFTISMIFGEVFSYTQEKAFITHTHVHTHTHTQSPVLTNTSLHAHVWSPLRICMCMYICMWVDGQLCMFICMRSWHEKMLTSEEKALRVYQELCECRMLVFCVENVFKNSLLQQINIWKENEFLTEYFMFDSTWNAFVFCFFSVTNQDYFSMLMLKRNCHHRSRK